MHCDNYNLTGAFEAALQNTPTLEKNDSGFLLKETNCCWKSLQSCWEHGVYIEALTHKFWKLTLQLLSRYAKWVHTCTQVYHY